MSDGEATVPATGRSEEQHQQGWYNAWGAWHDFGYSGSSAHQQAPRIVSYLDAGSQHGTPSSGQEINSWRDFLPQSYRHQPVEEPAWQEYQRSTYGQGEDEEEGDAHEEEAERGEGEDGEETVEANDDEKGTGLPVVQVPPRLSLVRQSYLQSGDRKVVLLEPSMTPRQIQSLLDMEWERRGLRYEMGPKKLAIAVSEIKLEYGYDAQIGQAASKKIRLDSAMGRVQYDDNGSSEYLGEFITWQNKMTRKIIALRKTYAVDHKNFANDEERARAVYVNFRNLHEKSYDGIRLSQDAYSLKAMQDVEEKMKSVWKAFMEERIRPALGSQVDEHRLPLELIEFYSRDFRYKDQRRQATTECIKRYMMQILKRDPGDKNRFTSLRNRWRQEQHSLLRQKPKGGRSES